MNNKQDQYIEAMAKLLFLTQQGKVEWKPIDPNLIFINTDKNRVSSAYTCSYKEKNLRIYERNYKPAVYDTRNLGLGAFVTSSGSIDSTALGNRDLVSEVILEIVDDKNNPLWQFPKEKILKDLLETVRYKISGAQDLIQSLISDS